MTTRASHLLGRFGAAALLVSAAGGLPGCRGDRSDKRPHQFLPDMDDSPKWKPQTGSEFFADGRTMRQPPIGTVAFGRVAFLSDEAWATPFMAQRDDLLKLDDAFYRGYTGRTKRGEAEVLTYVDRIPPRVTVDAALIARGADRFAIYCAACHGYAGDGKGMVGQRWSAPVPSWHDPKYSDPNEPDGKNKDGFLFVTARLGVPGVEGLPSPEDTPEQRRIKLEKMKMPGYAHAVSERDAWAIVAYIRVLQASRRGTAGDIPADLRDPLERDRQEQIARARAAAAAAGSANPVPANPVPANPTPASPTGGR